jgi:hypothetical protein
MRRERYRCREMRERDERDMEEEGKDRKRKGWGIGKKS